MAAISVGRALPTKIEAYLFYKVDRYDLHGKDILRTNPKEYIVDLGIRSYWGDTSRLTWVVCSRTPSTCSSFTKGEGFTWASSTARRSTSLR